MMLKNSISESLIEKIIASYNIEVSQLLPQQSGYRNLNQPLITKDGEELNLILYKNEPGILDKIRLANVIGSHLSKKGLPARSPYTNKILKITYSTHTKYACLYNYLPGHTIPWEGYTKKHLQALGQTLALIHQYLKSYKPIQPVESVAQTYLKLTRQSTKYFEQSGVNKAMRLKLSCSINKKELNKLSSYLKKLDNLPDKQILHMDFVRGNVLFESNPVRISGLLDFEKSAYGHPYFDIARTLSFLLVDCKYKSPQDVRKYFLNKGYFKNTNKNPTITIKLHGQKIDLLETLADCFLLFDFYKFLKHNPFEYLNQNEHYSRTRDLLISRGLVVKTTR